MSYGNDIIDVDIVIRPRVRSVDVVRIEVSIFRDHLLSEAKFNELVLGWVEDRLPEIPAPFNVHSIDVDVYFHNHGGNRKDPLHPPVKWKSVTVRPKLTTKVDYIIE